MFEKPMRQWLPPQFRIEGWSSVAPYVETLITAEWRSFSDFHRWLQRLNEVEAVISEEAAWNFIRFTQNTQDEASKLAYERYITEVQPRLSEARYQLYKRYWESPWRSLLPEEEFLRRAFQEKPLSL
jgi:oligoendopeptidase F